VTFLITQLIKLGDSGEEYRGTWYRIELMGNVEGDVLLPDECVTKMKSMEE
jgi:hypothetical protein